MRVLACLLSAFVFSACGDHRGPDLLVDQNGFVLNSSRVRPTVKVGVGMAAPDFLAENPTLRKVAWIPSPGSVFDELRLSLQTQTDLKYDDGVMSFSVCAHSASIDGSNELKVGVASVGFTVCDPPVDDASAAIKQAAELLELLRSQQPKVIDLSAAYRTASQEELTRIGGKLWRDLAIRRSSTVPAPRDDPSSMDHLKTLDEAQSYFRARKVNGVAMRRADGRIDVGLVLVGVFATDKAIVEVGVSGADAFGGQNLTAEQRNAIRYQAGMSVRLRPQ